MSFVDGLLPEIEHGYAQRTTAMAKNDVFVQLKSAATIMAMVNEMKTSGVTG